MLTLAVFSQDYIILSGMGVAISASLALAIFSRLLAVRLGSLVAAVTVCVGLAYFGWKPLFGGSHDPGIYFGCIMLFLGTLALLLLAAVEQSSRHPARSHGFPVEPPLPRSPAKITITASKPRP